MIFLNKKEKGFTLIEVIVAISILAIISTLVFTAVYQGRSAARDMSRISYVEQLRLALKLYKETNGTYPMYDVGLEIGIGEPIDADLAPFMAEIKADPLSNQDDSYKYWYFSDFTCNGVSQPAIFAQTMEKEQNSNYEDVCGGS